MAGRHADNVAPCAAGAALVLVLGLDPPRDRAAAACIPTSRLVLLTPAYAVETAQARAVLPAHGLAGRRDRAGRGAWRACWPGLEQGDIDLVRRSMADRVAEPARLPLYPGYVEARAAGWEAGAPAWP